jgi:ABC-type maltose transport system permease subunit
MTDIVIAIIIGVLTAFILSAAAYIFAKLKSLSKKNTAIENGVQILLKYCIIQMFNHYTAKEFIPIYARQNVENLHKEYKILGGNGTVDVLVNKLMELPVDKPKDSN